MQRDREYMLDILEAAKLAIKYTDEITREEFFGNTQNQDAVIRRIEIIGEAGGGYQKKHRLLHILKFHGAT